MRGFSSEPGNGATNVTIGSGSETGDTIGSDSDGSEWFADLARPLLGKDPGVELHYLTGFPASSCYKYASGERKPPGYFIRTLLHTANGDVWLAALMAGCEAQWWKDLQRARKLAEAIDKIE